MKRCTMRLSSVDGHLDLVGDTTGETESGTLSEHTDVEVTPPHPTDAIPTRDTTTKCDSRRDIRQGVRTLEVRRQEWCSAEGFLAKFSMVRTGSATSRRSFVISLLWASIREPVAALRQSGPASSAWQEHHELPLILLLHGQQTGCTTCGLE